MRYVLGDGLIGRIAGKLLNLPVVKFGRSRFYSYSLALADDYVSHVGGMECLGLHPSPEFHVIKASVGGQLLGINAMTMKAYCDRAYGEDSHISKLNRSGIVATSSRTCTELLRELNDVNVMEGGVVGIEPGTLIFNGRRLEYESLVSTIPLTALMKLIGMSMELKSIDVHYTHVMTDSLDLEGANEVWVLDDFEFFKVICVGNGSYVFWSKARLDDFILSKFLKSFKTVQQTLIREAIPIGLPPDLSFLEPYAIKPVGSCAQWDDAMDVSSCVKRIQTSM